MHATLGNSKAKQAKGEGVNVTEFEPVKGNRVTTVYFPEDMKLGEAFTTVTTANGVWENHSDGAPDWVESDSKGLAELLAEHYGCRIGRPKDWKEAD